MYSTGIVRKVDELGRIVIPKETRGQLYLEEGDSLEVFIDEDENKIVMKKYSPGCVFCGTAKDVTYFKNVCICKECLFDIKNQGE
jgi:looped-hinge helix DNA binding domain, AbrB family